MALFTGSHLIVPKSISASSTKALERKILIEQAKTQREYKFINFYFDPVRKEHVGWFYDVEDEQKLLMENINAKASE